MNSFFRTADNRPFFSLGGQSHNSSGYTRSELETAVKAVKTLKGNTIEVPVYWEQIEPAEGSIELGIVDEILDLARENHLKVILLWFATWKNGMMRYAPEWVKKDTRRFRRVVSAEGLTIPVLSSHCMANLEADKRAFCRLMEYIRLKDSDNKTVIAIQIENEPGILGSDRDYSTEAEREFDSPVPELVIDRVRISSESQVFKVWTGNGSRYSGSWPELFGTKAGEFFTAWSIAKYVDMVAAAGKAVYDIPFYANAWLSEQEWRIPGLNYPSGGPNTVTLDFWKWTAPHLDLIAPDIYFADSGRYRDVCRAYDRADNPLFIPESGRTPYNPGLMFYAIANHSAIGYHVFGVEDILSPDGTPREGVEELVSSFRSVASVLPLLARHESDLKLYAIYQEEAMTEQYLDLGAYIGLARFAGCDGHVFRDYHHNSEDHDYKNERGRGLVIQKGEGEFYVLGSGFRLLIKKKGAFSQMAALSAVHPMLDVRLNNYIKVEEGWFDEDGTWIATRKRNGDESDYGIWTHYDTGAVHVIMDQQEQ